MYGCGCWPRAETSTPSISCDVTLRISDDFCGIHPSTQPTAGDSAAFEKDHSGGTSVMGKTFQRSASTTVTTTTPTSTTTTTTTAVAQVFPSVILVRSYIVFWYLFRSSWAEHCKHAGYPIYLKKQLLTCWYRFNLLNCIFYMNDFSRLWVQAPCRTRIDLLYDSVPS